MPIVDNLGAPELPWRPNYRVWAVAGQDETVDCTLHYSTIEPGAGAPLHTHETDELIVVLEGQLNGVLGDQRQIVETNQTMVIPKGVPHGFTAAGPTTARTLAFFPTRDGMQRTAYLEGKPPKVYQKDSPSSVIPSPLINKGVQRG
jgi:quercetin dioxygenase-like cupin family protein